MPCALPVFVVARLKCFPALLCVLIFHQVLLNTEEGSPPPTSPQTNCLIDCRGGSEADGWLHKDLMRPYLQTLNPYFHKCRKGLATGHRNSLLGRRCAHSQHKHRSRAVFLPGVGTSCSGQVTVAPGFFLPHPFTHLTSLSSN